MYRTIYYVRHIPRRITSRRSRSHRVLIYIVILPPAVVVLVVWIILAVFAGFADKANIILLEYSKPVEIKNLLHFAATHAEDFICLA